MEYAFEQPLTVSVRSYRSGQTCATVANGVSAYQMCSFISSVITSTWLCFFNTSPRSEEHTSELQSLMRISYAVFCLKKKNIHSSQLNLNRILSTIFTQEYI